MAKNLILDFETLSKRASECAVVNVAYSFFDWDRFTSDDPYTYDNIRTSLVKFAVKDQVERLGYVIEKENLEWWNKQEPEVKKMLKPSSEDVSVSWWAPNFIVELESKEPKEWWSRGNSFDPVILDRIMNDSGCYREYSHLLKFFNLRDTRTWIEAKLNFPARNDFSPYNNEDENRLKNLKHNPEYDVKTDILRLQKIARIEAYLE